MIIPTAMQRGFSALNGKCDRDTDAEGILLVLLEKL